MQNIMKTIGKFSPVVYKICSVNGSQHLHGCCCVTHAVLSSAGTELTRTQARRVLSSVLLIGKITEPGVVPGTRQKLNTFLEQMNQFSMIWSWCYLYSHFIKKNVTDPKTQRNMPKVTHFIYKQRSRVPPGSARKVWCSKSRNVV